MLKQIVLYTLVFSAIAIAYQVVASAIFSETQPLWKTDIVVLLALTGALFGYLNSRRKKNEAGS